MVMMVRGINILTAIMPSLPTHCMKQNKPSINLSLINSNDLKKALEFAYKNMWLLLDMKSAYKEELLKSRRNKTKDGSKK